MIKEEKEKKYIVEFNDLDGKKITKLFSMKKEAKIYCRKLDKAPSIIKTI